MSDSNENIIFMLLIENRLTFACTYIINILEFISNIHETSHYLYINAC